MPAPEVLSASNLTALPYSLGEVDSRKPLAQDPGGPSVPLAEIAFTVCLRHLNVNVWQTKNCHAAWHSPTLVIQILGM
jgi:hypothetical protein